MRRRRTKRGRGTHPRPGGEHGRQWWPAEDDGERARQGESRRGEMMRREYSGEATECPGGDGLGQKRGVRPVHGARERRRR